ncbi:hypothetical protein ABK046_44880, partial [Streptomyces caeruleatus]
QKQFMSQRKVNIDETYIVKLNSLKELYTEEKQVKVTQQKAVELAINETLERKKKKHAKLDN